jgi:hypothetical protein
VHDGAVLSFLERLEAAGDISSAERELIAGDWLNEQRAVNAVESEYWALRLVRDLGRALGARDQRALEGPLQAAEDQLVRDFAASLTRR